MQIIHNDFKIDLRSHSSMLSLGGGGSKTKQKEKKKKKTSSTGVPPELFGSWMRV